RTDWHRLIIWRGLANVVEQYVRKGSQLYIEGKIRNNEWTDANGQKRYGVEIYVDVMNMLGRRDGAMTPQPLQPSQPMQRGPQQEQYNPQGINSYQASAQQQTATAPSYEDTPDEIDDLPF
ncbi:MAG: single-stranded DNA-binding protein, partial [Rikenellaceae bacterium]